MDFKDKKKMYYCGLFVDGYMVLNNTWIKMKVGEYDYEVYYPPKNASDYVSKALPKKIINGWEYMVAEIKCNHGMFWMDLIQNFKC